MADQSHLEAMREAIRGDLERARARRPSIFERPAPPPVEIRKAAPPAPEPEPVAVEPEPVAVEPEPAAVEPEPVAVESEPEPEPAPAVEAPRPSLLTRLAFWRR
jgi:hypothetical protein